MKTIQNVKTKQPDPVPEGIYCNCPGLYCPGESPAFRPLVTLHRLRVKGHVWTKKEADFSPALVLEQANFWIVFFESSDSPSGGIVAGSWVNLWEP